MSETLAKVGSACFSVSIAFPSPSIALQDLLSRRKYRCPRRHPHSVDLMDTRIFLSCSSRRCIDLVAGFLKMTSISCAANCAGTESRTESWVAAGERVIFSFCLFYSMDNLITNAERANKLIETQ